MRHNSMERLSAFAVLCATLLSGCAGTRVVDLAGRVVSAPLVVARSVNLELAVDSDEAGLRAVTEVLVEIPNGAQPAALESMTLQTGNQVPLLATRMASSRPFCVSLVRRHAYDPNWDARVPPQPRSLPQRPAWPDEREECHQFVQSVRAEFRVQRLPQNGDSVVLRYGGVSFASIWSNPDN